jgi:nicotinamidase-related amidase
VDLIDLVDPATTVVLTQECQRGVIGDLSALPALADAARTTGVIDNIGRIVEVGRDAGCPIVHCIAATRADRLGASTNAPLFAAAARGPVMLLPGSEAVEVVDGISDRESDIVSTRLAGLSPVNGTEVPMILRNLGARTIVIVGVSTNVAIPNATFDCVNAGFNVVIPRDAITGYPVEYTDHIVQNTLSVVAKICVTEELVAAWTSS